MTHMKNIVEILKDCPKGTELYSPIFGKVYLDKIRPHLAIVVATDKEQGNFKEEFLYDGRYGMNGECMLFPSEDQRDWSKFQRSFKDGDIVATANGNWIGITKGGKNNCFIPTYCVIQSDGKFEAYFDTKETWVFHRLATEAEKEKLFKAIKENGYKWNSETKTLEKFELKFKVGDRVSSKNTDMIGIISVIISDHREYRVALEKGGMTYILFEHQDDWYLIKNNTELKFKVGDRVIKKKDDKSGIITEVFTDSFKVDYEGGSCSYVQFYLQDDWDLVQDNDEPKFKVGDKIKHKDSGLYCTLEGYSTGISAYRTSIGLSLTYNDLEHWELVPNKFDISTLKPFESRVLVRDYHHQYWKVSFFGHFDKFMGKFDTVRGEYMQCIPYEGNEHLLGTSNDCDEYYKNW